MKVIRIVTARNMGNSQYSVIYEEVDICPACGATIQAVDLNFLLYIERDGKIRLSIQNLCRSCCSTFLCQYTDPVENKDSRGNFTSYEFDHRDFCCPSNFVTGKIDSRLEIVSEKFIAVYSQAQKAEHFELNQIAGMGYRKALECLIKDFLITEKSDLADTIRTTPLGSCVDRYVDNAELKIAASRATWLGNDQVHYMQKYADKDISDLKRLIRLSMYWICMILETRDAESIPHPSIL